MHLFALFLPGAVPIRFGKMTLEMGHNGKLKLPDWETVGKGQGEVIPLACKAEKHEA